MCDIVEVASGVTACCDGENAVFFVDGDLIEVRFRFAKGKTCRFNVGRDGDRLKFTVPLGESDHDRSLLEIFQRMPFSMIYIWPRGLRKTGDGVQLPLDFASSPT
jgi:hypothetical protein